MSTTPKGRGGSPGPTAEVEGVTRLEEPTGDLYGEDAAALGRAYLREALGSDEAIEEEIQRGRGRRPVDPALERGSTSPVSQVRLSQEQEAGLLLLTERVGKKKSVLLREAVDLLLGAYRVEPAEKQEPDISDLRRTLSEALSIVDHLAEEPAGSAPKTTT
jgi:hypothetical protein